MIHITDKKNCCGCSACVQRCPKQCIRLEEDTEGFLYPKVDEEACIKCGLCEKVCPILNQADKLPVQEVLAVKNQNEEERVNSSSGGVSFLLQERLSIRAVSFLELSMMIVGKCIMFMPRI